MGISIIGGTGDEGFGLTLRLARAGNRVTIGSRIADKGSAVADTAREMLGAGANVDGAANEEAATARTSASHRRRRPRAVATAATTQPSPTASSVT